MVSQRRPTAGPRQFCSCRQVRRSRVAQCGPGTGRTCARAGMASSHAARESESAVSVSDAKRQAAAAAVAADNAGGSCTAAGACTRGTRWSMGPARNAARVREPARGAVAKGHERRQGRRKRDMVRRLEDERFPTCSSSDCGTRGLPRRCKAWRTATAHGHGLGCEVCHTAAKSEDARLAKQKAALHCHTASAPAPRRKQGNRCPMQLPLTQTQPWCSKPSGSAHRS